MSMTLPNGSCCCQPDPFRELSFQTTWQSLTFEIVRLRQPTCRQLVHFARNTAAKAWRNSIHLVWNHCDSNRFVKSWEQTWCPDKRGYLSLWNARRTSRSQRRLSSSDKSGKHTSKRAFRYCTCKSSGDGVGSACGSVGGSCRSPQRWPCAMALLCLHSLQQKRCIPKARRWQPWLTHVVGASVRKYLGIFSAAERKPWQRVKIRPL